MYYNTPITFDIETSKYYHERFRNPKSGEIEPISFMYIWQMCINGIVYMGRRWSDYVSFMYHLIDRYSDAILVVYVHNLGYEFQFMKNFVPIDRVFAKSKRKVITVDAFGGRVQYRCSWALSNMSLDMFIRKTVGVKHGKMVGDLDYNVLRTAKTYMTDTELGYGYNDVAGLYEAITIRMERDADNIATIPLTATGYVRRKARNAMLVNPNNHKLFIDRKPTEHIYKMLLDASRGGDTHGNIRFVNVILYSLLSMDIKSSYPYVMVARKFPMTKWVAADINVDTMQKIVDAGKLAVLLTVQLFEIDVISYGLPPYISFSKCKKHYGVVQDNGRVLSAKLVELVITDIDYRIIRECYSIKYIKIVEAYTSYYAYLPDEYRDIILSDFRNKCELEDVDDYLYNKYKNDFNAYFGMMLQKIIDSEYVFDGCVLKPQKIPDYLEKHYSRKNNFLSYDWGVWVTAHARDRLYQGYIATKGLCVYGDTDSIKGFRTSKFIDAFYKLNQERDKEERRCGKCLTVELDHPDGKKSFTLGKWEQDAEYDEFKYLGAKKYAYKDTAGEIHITVAGLSKTKGAEYLESHAGMEDFEPGTIFDEGISGRTTAYWHDYEKPFMMQIDGIWTEIGSNVAVVDTTYTLTIGEDYQAIIDEIQCND